MSTHNPQPQLREAAAFYAPLAINNMMMMLSHTLIAAGLARTASPVVALAAFALARSVVHMIENPLLTVRQLTVVFGSTDEGARRTVRFVLTIAAAIALILLLLGFLPFGPVLITTLFRVGDEAAVEVVKTLRAFSVLPFLVGYRSFRQGLLIRRRNTSLLPLGTLIRLVAIFAWAICVPRFDGWGAASGAVALVAAITIETLFILACARHRTGEFPGTTAPEPDSSYRAIVLFSLPLTLMTLLHTLSIPVVNFGLGRMPNAITAMAAFAVGESLIRLAVCPVESLHQLVMVFGRDTETARQLRRIVLGFGVVMTTLMVLLSVTVIDTIVHRMMGVTGDTALWAAWVFRVMALQPLIVAVREYHWGHLFKRRATTGIGAGKALNLLTVVALMGVGVKVMGQAGAVLGAITLTIGEAVEAGFIARFEAIGRRRATFQDTP